MNSEQVMYIMYNNDIKQLEFIYLFYCDFIIMCTVLQKQICYSFDTIKLFEFEFEFELVINPFIQKRLNAIMFKCNQI